MTNTFYANFISFWTFFFLTFLNVFGFFFFKRFLSLLSNHFDKKLFILFFESIDREKWLRVTVKWSQKRVCSAHAATFRRLIIHKWINLRPSLLSCFPELRKRFLASCLYGYWEKHHRDEWRLKIVSNQM